MSPSYIDLHEAKLGFACLFDPQHPARVLIESLPDQREESEFAVAYEMLIRLAGVKTEGA